MEGIEAQAPQTVSFGKAWAFVLMNAMLKSGKGYRKTPQKRRGRREDKVEFNGPQWLRRYRDRYSA